MHTAYAYVLREQGRSHIKSLLVQRPPPVKTSSQTAARVGTRQAAMGKKGKSSAKKEQRQARMRRREALETRLRAPRALEACGAGFLQPALLAVGNLRLSWTNELSTPDRERCFAILEANMRAQYETNGWGWDATEKARELAHEEARFVLVRDTSDAIQAFAHFRFEADDDDAPERATLYVRELQVAAGGRRQGVGRQLMALLQLLGAKLELDCVLLTVFKNDAGALAFYDGLKYVLDRDDPSLFDREECYRILSRALPKKPLREAN